MKRFTIRRMRKQSFKLAQSISIVFCIDQIMCILICNCRLIFARSRPLVSFHKRSSVQGFLLKMWLFLSTKFIPWDGHTHELSVLMWWFVTNGNWKEYVIICPCTKPWDCPLLKIIGKRYSAVTCAVILLSPQWQRGDFISPSWYVSSWFSASLEGLSTGLSIFLPSTGLTFSRYISINWDSESLPFTTNFS